MRLSEHFTLDELTVTSTGLPNNPDRRSLVGLTRLCYVLLEPIRELAAGSVHVNSGYRSEAVNRAVGGSETSRHRSGAAADIWWKDDVYVSMADLCQYSFDAFPLDFDQIIHYPPEFHRTERLHVGLALIGQDPRREVLICTGPKSYKPWGT